MRSLITLRAMVETWKHELRAFAKASSDTLSQATVKTLYMSVLSLSSIIASMTSKKGPVGQHAKALAQHLSQI